MLARPTSVPECYVNTLAVHDLDLDGTPELIASTCQVEPRGRPRLHVWSLLSPPVPLCSASPDIKSSWSHGLGYIPASDTQSHRLFGTYCGFGEIVEYKLGKDEDNAGFHRESLAWKQVGQLAASGESLRVEQVDNDGKDKVVVAVGYARHQAAIRIYDVKSRGEALALEREIDEQGRFGNVSFLIAESPVKHRREVIAWWTTGLLDGECEIVRYSLTANGSVQRGRLRVENR